MVTAPVCLVPPPSPLPPSLERFSPAPAVGRWPRGAGTGREGFGTSLGTAAFSWLLAAHGAAVAQQPGGLQGYRRGGCYSVPCQDRGSPLAAPPGRPGLRLPDRGYGKQHLPERDAGRGCRRRRKMTERPRVSRSAWRGPATLTVAALLSPLRVSRRRQHDAALGRGRAGRRAGRVDDSGFPFGAGCELDGPKGAGIFPARPRSAAPVPLLPAGGVCPGCFIFSSRRYQ